MAVVKSLLKEIIEAFPEGQTVKGSNLEPMLKKKGVKPEEIKFADLGIDPTTRYDKESLQKLEAGRQDKFETTEIPKKEFEHTSLHDVATNPTYKEKVITFSQPKTKTTKSTRPNTAEIAAQVEELRNAKTPEEYDTLLDKFYEQYPNTGETIHRVGLDNYPTDDVVADILEADQAALKGSRYTSEHFPEQENYLMHNRVFDDTIDGKSTRVLEEIQSDLHQEARKRGYQDTELDIDFAKGNQELEQLGKDYDDFYLSNENSKFKTDEEAAKAVDQFKAKYNIDEDILILDYENLESIIRASTNISTGLPQSPYQKTWLRKGIERELVDAINEGQQQLAIPIKGAVYPLNRGEGVQKWYETQVANTAKKVAKSTGADFKMQTVSKNENIYRADAISYISNIFSSGPVNTAEIKKLAGQSDEALKILTNMQTGNTPIYEGITKLANLKEDLTIDYAIITPKAGSQPTVTLYSAPIAGGFAVYTALRMGYTQEEITAKLKADGEDDDDIAATFETAQKMLAAHNAGYSDEEIQSYLMQQQPKLTDVQDSNSISLDEVGPATAKEILEKRKDTPFFSAWYEKYDVPESLVKEKQESMQGTWEQAYAATVMSLKEKVTSHQNLTDLDYGMDAETLVANLKVTQPNMSSITTRIAGYFGNQNEAKVAADAEYASRQRILDLGNKLLAESGRSLKWYDPRDPKTAEANTGLLWDPGTWLVVNPDGTKVPANPGFWASLQSESSEITGAVVGGITGAKVGAKYTPGPWWAKLLGGGVGSLVGASSGASIGSQFDYMSSAIQTHQNMSSEVAAHRALTAAEASIIGDAVAYPVAKGMNYGWRAMIRAKNFIFAGNPEGARRALKESMHLADSEIEDIVTQLQRVADVPGTLAGDKEIAAFIATQPGGEGLMRAAGAIDDMAGKTVAKEIDKRAQDLLKTTQSISDENIGKLIKEDFNNYVADVKNFYGTVKAQVAKSPNSNKWSFDYSKLAINPVLEQMEKRIEDVPALERFLRRAELIRARADGRTLADLLDLRQMINGFRFGRGTKKATELQTYKDLLKTIDASIDQGAEVVMDQPKAWKNSWSEARISYAKMKELEKNTIIKVLNRPGVDETIVVKNLTKYITALDETWTDAMAALPATTKHKAEGAVINALAEKFTAGVPNGTRATNFPMLANELSKTTFTTPDARKLKAAINVLGDTFKNDVPLAQQTGNIIIPKEQSYLTTDPVIRIKYELASKMFNYSKRLFPTQQGRATALIMRTAQLLENPLNVKSAKELMDEVGEAVNLSPDVIKLQRAAANEAAKTTSSPLVRLYGTGNTLDFTGSGKPTTKIHMSRIATQDIAIQVAEAEGISRSNVKALEHALKQRGYQAIMSGTEKVKLL